MCIFCIDRATSRIYTSRHVVFHEYIFPFSMTNPLTTASSSELQISESPQVATPVVFLVPISTSPSNPPTNISNTATTTEIETAPTSAPTTSSKDAADTRPSSPPNPTVIESAPVVVPVDPPPPIPPRQSQRQ